MKGSESFLIVVQVEISPQNYIRCFIMYMNMFI